MLSSIAQLSGEISFFYKNLITGETIAHQADLPLLAASVIKLPIMIEAYRQFANGSLDPALPVTVRTANTVPGCGVLKRLHDGLIVTVKDLVKLMIIVSDNTATNLLTDIVGIDHVNQTLDTFGMQTTRLRRKMYDLESAARGLQNTITAAEIGLLLEKLYYGRAVSPESDLEMLQILKNQQLNGKIPFFIGDLFEIAHKTGEDDGITHDVGIVYADTPFILCCCANKTNVPKTEQWIQNIARELLYK